MEKNGHQVLDPPAGLAPIRWNESFGSVHPRVVARVGKGSHMTCWAQVDRPCGIMLCSEQVRGAADEDRPGRSRPRCARVWKKVKKQTKLAN